MVKNLKLNSLYLLIYAFLVNAYSHGGATDDDVAKIQTMSSMSSQMGSTSIFMTISYVLIAVLIVLLIIYLIKSRNKS